MMLCFTNRAAAEAHVARMKSKRERARIVRLHAGQARPAREWQDLGQDSDAPTFAADPHAVVVDE